MTRIDDHDPILDAIATLRRPAWPAVAPAFGGSVPRGEIIDPLGAIARGRVRAQRWTCDLSPDRYHAWREGGDARSRLLVVSAVDADPAVPVQLYWMLDRAEAFGRALAALRAAVKDVATLVVVVPDDVPARWRSACKSFAPRRVDPAYPAGNWRLVPRAAHLNSRHALVLDVVATLDLLGDNVQRPMAVVGAGDAVYRLAHRDDRVGDLRSVQRFEDDAVDVFIGPRLRGRPARDEATIGDGDVTLHVVPREVGERSPCVRCSWCVAACPTRCDPVELMNMATTPHRRATPRRLHRAGLDACIDCGLCTAVCPSLLPLHGYIDALRRHEAGPGAGAAR